MTTCEVGVLVWPTQEELQDSGFKVLVSADKGDLSAGIYTTSGGKYHLTWSDGVANSWRQSHRLFSNAVAALAMLARCEESEWQLFGRPIDEEEFAKITRHFFREITE